MAPFVSQCYPRSRHGIPNQQACLVQSQSGARLAWNIMPVYLPNGTQKILIFKSSSGEERQIWEYLEWRGGRVGHPDQLRDGSNEDAAASPAPPCPKTMSHESCEYPETPVKTSLQTNADVQDHALPSTL